MHTGKLAEPVDRQNPVLLEISYLWTGTAAYEASLWNITSSGTQTSQTFGPYGGWKAITIAPGPGP